METTKENNKQIQEMTIIKILKSMFALLEQTNLNIDTLTIGIAHKYENINYKNIDNQLIKIYSDNGKEYKIIEI